MPIYEYRCPNGHNFELFQSFADAPPTECETCGASPLERVLFPVAVHFKGSGFYSTDYGKGSRKPAAKESGGDSGSSSGSDGGSSSGSDGGSSSSETKSEPKAAAAD